MKLTPLDIHHKEFRHSLRGYSEEEVDHFLDEVADEFERLFKENIDLSERLESANAAVRAFQDQEQIIRNTMISAQRSAEEIVAKAREEATSLFHDAEIKAKEIIHNALTQKQKVQQELIRIKGAEEEFRAAFKKVLEGHMSSVREIPLPDDVSVLIGETDDGVVGSVEVSGTAAASAAPAPAEPPAELFVAEAAAADSAQAPENAAALPGPAFAPPADEPPASGFVQSLTLGEMDAPDIEPDISDAPDPREFDLSAFGSDFGEREDDIDIEEID